MKRMHFLSFDFFWPARPVWKDGETPAAPAAASPEGDKKPAARPDATSESSAEAGKAAPAVSPAAAQSPQAAAVEKARADKVKAATAAGAPNPEEADTFLKRSLAQLLGPPPSGEKAATTADATPTPEKPTFSPERVAEVFNRNKEKFQKFIKDFLQNPNGFAEAKNQLAASVQTADREVVEYMLRVTPISEEEEKSFTARFAKPNENPDPAAILQQIIEGVFTPRDFILALSYIRREDVDTTNGLSPVERDNLTNVIRIIPREVITEDQAKAVIEKHKSAYEKFLQDKDDDAFFKVLEAAKDDNGSHDKDLHTMSLYLNQQVTKKEMQTMQTKLKSGEAQMPSNEQEIDALVKNGTRTYREGLILGEILHDLGTKAAAEGSTLEQAVEKVGFFELLERLMDKLTLLANRLEAEFEKFFNKGKQPKVFPNSPVGKDQKVTVVKPFNKDHPGGIDLKAEQPNQQVTAVIGGIVSDVSGNSITIATKNAKITYTGIVPAGLVKDKAVDAGTVLGQINGDTFNLRVTDPEGKQQYDPTSLLKPEFVNEAAQPTKQEKAEEGTEITKLTDQNFKAETAKGIHVVDFYADWCEPCKKMQPTFEAIAKENVGKAKLARLNIDPNPNTTKAFNVGSIPTLIFMQDGVEVGRLVGAQPKEEIDKKLSSIIQAQETKLAKRDKGAGEKEEKPDEKKKPKKKKKAERPDDGADEDGAQALATNGITKLKLSYKPANPAAEGLTFNVEEGTPVLSLFGEGAATKGEVIDTGSLTGTGRIEVTYNDYVFTYGGLDPDSMIKTAESYENPVTAKTELGKVGYGRTLTITVKKKDGTPVDPTSLLAEFIEDSTPRINTSPPPEVPADEEEDES